MRARAVALHDVSAICDVHQGSDGPWADPVECAIYVNHRLLRPFFCRVLERDGQVVGHAEWIIGQEPSRRKPYLYLGMLQVRDDSQGLGVGRRLIDDGVKLAAPQGCDRLRTVPDEQAVGFYQRCGFGTAAHASSFRSPASQVGLSTRWKRSRTVPARTSRELHMRLGWVQACSAHMWEISNRPVTLAGKTWTHPCVTDGSAFVQLRYQDRSQALALAWSVDDTPLEALIDAAHRMASARAISHLLLALRSGETRAIHGAEPAGRIPIMERPISADE